MPTTIASRKLVSEPRELDLTPIKSTPPTKAERHQLGEFFAAERAKNDQNPEIVAFRQLFKHRNNLK